MEILNYIKHNFIKKDYKFIIPNSEIKNHIVKYKLHYKNGTLFGEAWEENNDIVFYLRLTPKERDNIEKLAKSMSKEDNLPLYTFRCRKCKTVFILRELGTPIIFKKEVNVLDLGYYCKFCSKIQ